jgi:hypothetical protein
MIEVGVGKRLLGGCVSLERGTEVKRPASQSAASGLFLARGGLWDSAGEHGLGYIRSDRGCRLMAVVLVVAVVRSQEPGMAKAVCL